jgi:hypothetical protein
MSYVPFTNFISDLSAEPNGKLYPLRQLYTPVALWQGEFVAHIGTEHSPQNNSGGLGAWL